jgi:hypothetical protein
MISSQNIINKYPLISQLFDVSNYYLIGTVTVRIYAVNSRQNTAVNGIVRLVRLMSACPLIFPTHGPWWVSIERVLIIEGYVNIFYCGDLELQNSLELYTAGDWDERLVKGRGAFDKGREQRKRSQYKQNRAFLW